MRILSLVSDAFGGHGGIALYNRDFLTAMCRYYTTREVVAFPRIMPLVPEAFPSNLHYVLAGLQGRLAYVGHVLMALHRDRNFQIIHVGHLNLFPLGYLCHLITRAPMLLSIYGIDAWDHSILKLPRFLLRRVHTTISISKMTKERFLQWAPVSPNSVKILPNAIHLEKYGVRERNPDLISRYGFAGKRVIMTLGRIVERERYKGFDEVIDLMPGLLQQFPNLVYLIVGDGTDLPRLKQKVIDMGLVGKVIFAGAIPEDEKADHYRLADAYIMPSAGEGFGFVFLEALACGIPVVASKTDGSREAVRDGILGTMVDPTSPAEIEAAIIEALGKPRGIIPQGLSYFAWPEFERRCHRIMADIERCVP
ncbi:MAG: glycosyltransferase family 4 protein [Candidatus Riflebacteria bacterium]|nr:glycosyltransferase family 4 protein [Candidatus Riflebacteria bacterium]